MCLPACLVVSEADFAVSPGEIVCLSLRDVSWCSPGSVPSSIGGCVVNHCQGDEAVQRVCLSPLVTDTAAVDRPQHLYVSSLLYVNP